MNIIAELAGADSLAAIKLYQQTHSDNIIPSLVISPNENQTNLQEVINFYNQFIIDNRLQSLQIDFPNYQLWNELQAINLPSQCVLCHFYCHLMRIPLIQQYQGILLTGERKSHNGKIKWNQNEPILNMYNKIFDYFNIPIIKPLENIQDTQIINNLLIQQEQDKTHFLKCNYHSPTVDIEQLNFINDLYDKLLIITERWLKLNEWKQL